MRRHFSQFLFKLWALVVVVLLCLSLATPISAQTPSPTASESPSLVQQATGISSSTVVLGGVPLFEVNAKVGSLTAADRATIISQRLTQVANDSKIPVSSFRAEPDEENILILAGTQPPVSIAAITPKDAAANQKSQDQLAVSVIEKIRSAVATYRAERSPERILWGILYTVLATFGLLLAFRVVDWLYAASFDRLKHWLSRHQSLPGLRFTRSLNISPFLALLSRFADLSHNILNLVLLGFYFFGVLSFFPWTQPLAENFWSLLSTAFNQVINAVIGYLPKLIILVLIVFITREILSFIRLFFKEVGRGNISVSWLYSDWVETTFKLVSFLIIALAVAIALPFLPGFQSPAFQGVSILISALLTFGATGTVANIVGGVVSVYTRSYQIGDMVKISDLVGIVTAKDLLVTRIRTPKNEVITIPNSTIISSNVINYSALAKDTRDNTGLILHTTITLGYDIPWSKVHQALIAAAHATPDILSFPPPFVLQTALNDFNVSYELNAYTDHSEKMPALYSVLHQNIQDKCNEVGIEILSPHYLSMRDGNHSTIPETYLPDDYQSPGFRIDPIAPGDGS